MRDEQPGGGWAASVERAHQLMDQRDYRAAQQEFSTALFATTMPAKSRCSCLLNRGVCFLSRGLLKQARADFGAVLKIDVKAQTVTTLDTDLSGFGNEKWCGGVLARDGCIYGIPACASKVLKIHVKAQTVTTLKTDLGNAEWKWMLGALGPDDCVYCTPGNAHKVRTNIDVPLSRSDV